MQVIDAALSDRTSNASNKRKRKEPSDGSRIEANLKSYMDYLVVKGRSGLDLQERGTVV